MQILFYKKRKHKCKTAPTAPPRDSSVYYTKQQENVTHIHTDNLVILELVGLLIVILCNTDLDG